MNSTDTLLHLRDLSVEMKQLGHLLSSSGPEQGDENVEFVVGTSAQLEHEMSTLANSAEPGNPLDSRDLRHDLRNKVSVIKGFSDLMQMDVSPNASWAWILTRLIDLSDQFVLILDQARERSASDCGAAIFA